MPNIFNTIDKSGRKIRLTRERWQHITQEHPGITNPEELKETITNQLKITPSKYNADNGCYCYRYNKNLKRYLIVAVKSLNEDGFIITSYYTRKIQWARKCIFTGILKETT